MNLRFLAGLLAAVGLIAPLTAEPRAEFLEAERSHWAFQPVADVKPPESGAWAKSPIDGFVLRALRDKGLAPSEPASPRDLIRRVTYTLTGLPPAPEDVAAFVADPSDRAYEAYVDRLLARPAYGERWAQHWLDVVRYAETEGFEYDRTMHGIWRYRDYVIRSMNDDKPYDGFIVEQLAGDELAGDDAYDEANQELLVAAGLHRLGAVRRNAGNQAVASSRNEVLTERTDIVGAAFLGLTMGCARCHDHRFDPIRQKDYYRMQAYVGGTREHNIVLASDKEQAEWKEEVARQEAVIKKLKKELGKLEGEEKGHLHQKIRNLEESLPAPLPTIATVREEQRRDRTAIHMLDRGEWGKKKELVGMRPPGVMLPDWEPEASPRQPRPKLKLANWVASADNPLTPRVMVNRLWQGHFGRGIVGTANDFGFMGERPTHPELLDWLAREFVDGGFRLKRMHRMIVLSNAYRQSSRTPMSDVVAKVDPGNRLLWKANRRRLDAESLRDSMLVVSGAFNPKRGGRSVIVPVDEELVGLLYKPAQWQVAEDADAHNRRSIYLMAKRNLRLPFMEVFDQPALLTSCYRREESTHAPQALELLNGRTANRLADALAERLESEAPGDGSAQVERAYELAAGRPPSAKEKDLALSFLDQQPLREFALAVLNLNDFLYVN